MNYYSEENIASIRDILQIGIALTSEKDNNRLFEMILSEARKVTHADAGTLYLCEDECLHFKIMQNDRLKIFRGGGGEKIDLPPVPTSESNVAAYVAIHGNTINIPDVNDSDQFDFTGPKKYDEITGYKTKSMLVIPLKKRDGEIIGVLQLINALDENGEILPFPKHLEFVVESLASQAGIALSNMQYIEEIDLLFNSFVEVMMTTIDARSRFNINHTRSVVQLTEDFVLYLNQLYEKGEFHEYFDEQRRKQLVVAAWLHDIGKITVPTRVMDKATRLGRLYDAVKARFDLIRALQRLSQVELHIEPAICKKEDAKLEAAWKLINECNEPSCFVDESRKKKLYEIHQLQYQDLNGEWHAYLTEQELECLLVPSGTLTKEERKIMEDHVVMTRVMLDKMHFPKGLDQVPTWASMHHEFLDGSGYPDHLKGEQIPIEVRIMTITDIYDALTARDRPYKKPLPASVALDILNKMASEGKLDPQLVTLFNESNAWDQERNTKVVAVGKE